MNMNVAVVRAYLNSCILPCRLDSGKTICLDKIKPAGKLIANAMIHAPTSAVMIKLP